MAYIRYDLIYCVRINVGCVVEENMHVFVATESIECICSPVFFMNMTLEGFIILFHFISRQQHSWCAQEKKRCRYIHSAVFIKSVAMIKPLLIQ